MLRFSGSGYYRSIIIGDSIALSRLNELRVLDLTESTANDECMKVLSKSCPDLMYAMRV